MQAANPTYRVPLQRCGLRCEHLLNLQISVGRRHEYVCQNFVFGRPANGCAAFIVQVKWRLQRLRDFQSYAEDDAQRALGEGCETRSCAHQFVMLDQGSPGRVRVREQLLVVVPIPPLRDGAVLTPREELRGTMQHCVRQSRADRRRVRRKAAPGKRHISIGNRKLLLKSSLSCSILAQQVVQS